MLVNHIYDTTIDYGKRVNKSVRKKIGQFFTPPAVANYMANLMEYNMPTIKILDAGAGTGILAVALCEKILEQNTIDTVHIDLYENDENVLPVLRANMELVREVLENNGKKISYNIIQENFILHNSEYWNERKHREEETLYDVIISNPPYKKIGKSEPESVVMNSVIHGQPNIYFLFMALSAKLLKQNGQMIFITPRSFTSGLYFKKFREYFLNTVRLTNLHLFHSREDVFDNDKVLQEAIILKAIKTTQVADTILISASDNMYTGENFIHNVPYGTVVDMESDNLFIMIPTTRDEVELLNMMKNWKYDLPSLGFKLKTGPVVDFRATEFLREEEVENTVPLLWSNHFSNNRITFPVPASKNPQYILNTEESKGILLDSKDYILVKRFTSKEERKRVQCTLYIAKNFPYKKIGIENHLNYITKLNGEMTREEMFGLFAILNSSYVDTYYRILNGSTQVNATEMNSIPLPSLNDIIQIGEKVMNLDSITVEICDTIIDEMFTVIRSRMRNVV